MKLVAARVLGPVLAALVLIVGASTAASAHPLSTSAVLLDINAAQVDAKVELPLDQLSIALDKNLTATSVLAPSTLIGLRTYVQAHMSATDSSQGAWTTSVNGGQVERIDGVDHLVLDAALVPASGDVGDFELHYDAIVDTLQSHRVFVSARHGDTGSYTTLVMLSWQRTSVPVVSASAPAATSGFTSAVELGYDHIRSGSDHLLFLLMLLLPAPLLVRGRRWVRRPDIGSGVWRIVHAVTAFAIGHSIALVMGAVGLVHLPTRAVEAGIALSVLISALHAIRPIVRRGEVVIAVSFGLLHGLSFASVINELDLGRSSFVSTLLGSNLGIELTQLLVVALVMPSLMLLSRTRAYELVRGGIAGIGVILAAAWFGERLSLMPRNPLEPIAAVLVEHPLRLAAALAALALTIGWRQLLQIGRTEPADHTGAAQKTVTMLSGHGVTMRVRMSRENP
ncbi:MAG: HupE / UreJ protein [Aeromicrobium sp.]|nr:HupE / UreJ protein [Aeromicrobium sp.]